MRPSGGQDHGDLDDAYASLGQRFLACIRCRSASGVAWLGLLLVGIVEFMSTFGIFIAFNHGELGETAKRWRT